MNDWVNTGSFTIALIALLVACLAYYGVH